MKDNNDEKYTINTSSDNQIQQDNLTEDGEYHMIIDMVLDHPKLIAFEQIGIQDKD